MSVPAAIVAHPLVRQWFEIGPGRQLTVFTGKVELGQGIATALLQIACDALGVQPSQLVLVAGDTARGPDEGYTAGSLSVQQGGAALRWACQHVAARFAAAAAVRWNVPPDEVQVEAGVFSHPEVTQGLDYWSLDVDLAAPMHEPPPSTQVKGQSQVGRSMPRIDLRARLAGGGLIHDMVLPGMLHARVLRGAHPSQGLLEVPLADLQALPGVTQVVRSGNFLALLGPREGMVVRAAAKAETMLRRAPSALPSVPDAAAFLKGAPAHSQRVHASGAAAAGVHRHSASYSRPYLAHASIGPACALADPRGDQLRVWSHSQGVFPLRAQIAQGLRRDPFTVQVLHAPGAGCYGHNGADDVAFDAALIASLTGQAVRVQWMRHDELTASPFGAASAIDLQADMDAEGRITRWEMAVWSHTHMSRPGWGDGVQLQGAWEMDPPHPVPPSRDLPLPAGGGMRNAIAVYDLPHQQVDHHFVAEAPVRVSALRSLGSYANLYAIECFMDELASVAGADPVTFRLQHLQDERGRAVLERVAAMANWSERGEEGSGDGLGLAVGRYKNQAAWCAVAARVSVAEQVRVREVWVAVDAGAVINPDGLVNQIEGGVIQSLSWTLHEAVQWDATGITSADWEHYPIATFADVPALHVDVLERPDQPPLGVGEAAAGPTAAAVANAVAHALGLRARDLPLTADRLAALIQAS